MSKRERRRPDWREHAACRGLDPEVFFDPLRPEEPHAPGELAEWNAERRDRHRRARAICASCPVRQQCAEAAAVNGETMGIWGGLLANPHGGGDLALVRGDLAARGMVARLRYCEWCSRSFDSIRVTRYCPTRDCAEKARQRHYAEMEARREPHRNGRPYPPPAPVEAV